jgi:chromosome segregation ATPase
MTESKQLQELIQSFNNSYEQMRLVQESLKKLAEGTFDLSERIKEFGSQSKANELLPQLIESREQVEAIFTAVQQQVQTVEKKVGDLAESGQTALLRVANADSIIAELRQGIEKYTAILETCAVVTRQINDFVTVNAALGQNVTRTQDTIGELRLELQALHPVLEENRNLLQDTRVAQATVTAHLTDLKADSEICKEQVNNIVIEVQSLNSSMQDYVAAATPATMALRAAAEPTRQLLEDTGAFVQEARQTIAALETVRSVIASEHAAYQQLTGELAGLREDINLMATENRLLKSMVADFRNVQDQAKQYFQACVEATVQCRAEIGEMMERHEGICEAISHPTTGNEEQFYALFRKVMVDIIAEEKKKEGKGFIDALFHR